MGDSGLGVNKILSIVESYRVVQVDLSLRSRALIALIFETEV